MFRKCVLMAGCLCLSASVLAVPLQAADIESGAEVFKKCRACHQVGPDAVNAVGPVLNGLFGRKAGTVPGYTYSDANKASGKTWDEATFTDYIKDPKAAIPGTKMAFAGLKDPADIEDVIAYIKQFDEKGAKK